MPPALRKARVTWLPSSTSRNGPKDFGAGRPNRPAKNWAAASGSTEWTMVWLSLTAMALASRESQTQPDRRHGEVQLLLRFAAIRRGDALDVEVPQQHGHDHFHFLHG